MKIDNVYQNFVKSPENISQTHNEPQRLRSQRREEQPSLRGDRVDISQTSQDMRKIEKVLETTPEVRTEKVRALKEQIEAGTYQVDAKQVANAMMTDLLKDLA